MPTPTNSFISFENRFKDATPTASSTASGAAVNLSDFRPYTNWKPSALPATVTVDCGSAKAADYLAIFNHDLYTNGCTIEVRGSTDNFSASDVLVHSYTPSSNSPFVRNFTSASYRYWRMRITGSTAPTLTIAAVGVGLELPDAIQRGFDPLGRKIFGQANISEQGLPLGKSVLFEQWGEKITVRRALQTWVRATFIPAWLAHLRDKPFLYAHDLANHPGEIYLVQSGEQFSTPIISSTEMSLSFDIKGVA